MVPTREAATAVVTNSRILVRATGTPTLRAASASPPTAKIQLPKVVRGCDRRPRIPSLLTDEQSGDDRGEAGHAAGGKVELTTDHEQTDGDRHDAEEGSLLGPRLEPGLREPQVLRARVGEREQNED